MQKLIFGALTLGLALSLPAAAQVQSKDAKALKDLADADMTEVQGGKAAAERAHSPEVKKFAQHMQDDHGQNLSEVQKLAQAKGVDLPSQPSKKHQGEMKKLESQSGERFDKAYVDAMVKDHKEDLRKLKSAAKDAKDPEIKATLQKTAQTVEGHLKMAQDLQRGMGRTASNGSSSASSSRGSSSK
jgi:predicted outer membrane protein